MKARLAWALGVAMCGCNGEQSAEPAPPDADSVLDAGEILGDATTNDGAACASASVKAGKPPVDVILAIDQSGSMSSTIQSVKANLGKLTMLLDMNGLDAHVVVIAGHGPPQPGCFVTNLGPDKCPTADADKACWQNFEVCVPPPLGAATCGVENLPRFFQSNFHIESNDMLRTTLITYGSPLPNVGWKKMMRKESLKVFIPITDDDATVSFDSVLAACTAASYDPSPDWWSKTCTERAAASSKPPREGGCYPDYARFDDLLVTRDPAQFGTKSHRNYVVYPVVGAKAYPDETQCGCAEGSAKDAGACTGPMVSNNGHQYLELAKLTGGKWYSLCDVDFAPIFSKLATETLDRVACELAIPAPPPGESLDYNLVNVTWTSGSGATSTVPQDASTPCATANGWQYDEAKSRILLCGEVCTKARADAASRFQVTFGCRTIVR